MSGSDQGGVQGDHSTPKFCGDKAGGILSVLTSDVIHSPFWAYLLV